MLLRDDYPKITVVSEHSEKATEIKRILLSAGVFSDVLTADEARREITNTDLLVIYAERYSSRILSVINAIVTKSAGTKSLLIGEVDSFKDANFDACITYADAVNDNCVTDVLLDLLGESVFYTDGSVITTDLYKKHFVVYRGMKIFLTHTEALLVHFLSRAAVPFATPKYISHYVGISESSVPVTINSINNKAKALLNAPIIKAKRNTGYYIVK